MLAVWMTKINSKKLKCLSVVGEQEFLCKNILNRNLLFHFFSMFRGLCVSSNKLRYIIFMFLCF
jgi:hypothetical protein